MWKNASWILHHDNAPAHNALSVKRYLAKNNIPVMEHPPYSPDLAPCDFFSLPENQVCAQRNQVQVRGCSESKSDATLEQHNTR